MPRSYRQLSRASTHRPFTSSNTLPPSRCPSNLTGLVARRKSPAGSRSYCRPIPRNSGFQGGDGVQTGTVELDSAGGRFLLKVHGHARFRPANGVNYIIKLKDNVTVGSKQEGNQPARAVLPVGTQGLLALGKGEPLALDTVQPLSVRPWLLGTSRTLLPERASGHVGLADLAIEVRRSGLQLDGGNVVLSACALSSGDRPQQAGVSDEEPGRRCHDPPAQPPRGGSPHSFLIVILRR